MAADPDNLRIQQQINAAIAERGKLLSAQTSLISDQVELAVKFCKAMKCEDIDGISDRITEIRAGLESAGKAAKDSTGNIDNLIDGLGDASEKADELNGSTMDVKKAMDAAAKAADGFLSTLGEGIGSAVDVMSGLGSAAQSVGEAIFNIGAAILDIPLKVFDMMLGKAADLANASQEIRQAQEEVRKQFGDIQKGFAKEVVAGGANIAKGLSEAGTSVSQVFGMGPGGTAAAIRASLEMATALGPAVNLLGKNFGDAAGKLVVFQKGLGLSGEDMKAFVYASKSMGTDVNKDLEKVAKIADDMGDKFGMSSKDIARDMAFMTTQSAKFGRLTTEQMAAASVTVRSFGMELKDVVGIMDQFADFESAATNASKLAQAFGATIDPMRLMKEENPAKAFEYLRKQMLAAGQDASTMNRAQLKLLATQTNMDENMVKTAFSAKNVGKSYEQIQKEADKSGKKQKSQQEIFEQLGRSIEKMVESMQHSGSFMQEFLQGFAEGASRAGPFRQVLGDLAKALMVVRQVGRQVGDAFVKAFPGIKDMLGAMHDFFGGGSFTKAVKGFGDSIKEFFRDLNGDPTKAFEKFYDNIKKKFFDMLDSNSGPGKKFLEGSKKFIMALSGIIAGAVKALGEALATGLKQLAEFIKNPEEAMKAADQAGGSFFAPIMKSMGEVLPKIGDALMELLSALFWKIAPKLAVVIGAVFAFSIGKAFLLGAAQAVGGAMVAGGITLIKTGFSKLIGAAVAPDKKDAEKGAGNAKSFGAAVGDFFTELAVALGNAKAGIQLALENMPKPTDVLKFSMKLSLVALALAPLLVTLAILSPFAALAAVSAVAMQTIFESLAVMGEAVEKTKKISWGQAGKALAMLSLFILILTAVAVGAIAGFVYAMTLLPIATPADASKVILGTVVLGMLVAAVGGLAFVAALAGKAPVGQAVAGMLVVGAMMFVVEELAETATGFITSTKGLIKNSTEAVSVMVSLVALGVIVTAVAGLAIAAAFAGSIMAAASGAAVIGILAIVAMIPVVMLLAGITTGFIEMTKNLIKSPMEAVSVVISLGALALIVGAVAGLTLAAAAAGVILVASGGAALLGFAVMYGVMTEIMDLATRVAEMLNSEAVRSIEPMKALAFGAVFGLVLGAVAGVVIAAAAIGLLIVGTLGVGGVAIAAGMKIIADAMGIIQEYVPPIVDALVTAGASLTGEDVQKRAEAVGKILSGLGGLLSPIQAAVELSQSSEGMFTGGDLDGVKGIFEAVKGFIVDIMGTAQTVVSSLIVATRGLNENELKGVEAGGKVLGAVAQIVGSLTSVLTKIDFSGDPASIAAAGAVMKQAMPGLNSMLSNIGTQMKDVIDQVRVALAGISDADIKMLGPRLDMVGKIFGVIGDFSGMMKDNQITPDLAGATEVAGKVAGPVLDGFKGIMTKFIAFIKDDEGGLKEIVTALKTFPEFDAKRVDSVVKLFKDSIDIASAFRDMTKSFEDNFVTATGLKYSQWALTHAINFAKQASNDLKGVELLPGKKIENIKGAISYLGEMMSNYTDLTGNLKDVDTGGTQSKVGSVLTSLSAISSMMKGDTGMLTTISNFGELARVIDTFANSYAEGMHSFIADAVSDIRALDDVLARLEVDALDVTIDKLSEKLQIHREKVQIENKPINITLNMNVSFKAEEFVKDIFKVANNQAKKGKTDVVAFLQNPNDPKYDAKR